MLPISALLEKISLFLTSEEYHERQAPVMHVVEPKQLEVNEMAAGTSHEGEEGHGSEQLQFMLGLSLVLGFVFMLAVDQIGSAHKHTLPTAGEAQPLC